MISMLAVIYPFNTSLASTYYVPGTLAQRIQRFTSVFQDLRVDIQKGRSTSKSQYGVISEMHKTWQGKLRESSNPDLVFREQNGTGGKLLESK